MKSFTADAISARMISNLQTQTGWTQIISDSAITSEFNAHGEGNAELARYFEYLLRESKWTEEKNLNSLLTQCPYLGYKASRKVSSISNIVFSHDPQLQYSGIANIFSTSDLSTYLTYYSGSPSYFVIPKGTIISTGTIQFITTADVSYNTNTQYVQIPVIQGIIRSLTFQMLGNSFESIRIVSNYVEDGSNSISSNFLSVSITPSGSLTSIPYTKFEDIYLANYDDYAYDINTSRDYSYVTIRFGNGVAGSKVPVNSTATVYYLETLGSQGIVNTNFTINQIISTTLPIPMYATNFTSALGGSDEDTEDDIREKAPQKYLTQGGIITLNDYKGTVLSIPSVARAVAYSGTSIDTTTGSLRDTIFYSAVDTSGEAPDSTTISNYMETLIEGNTHPLDYVVYEAPAFLHLKIGVKGIAKSTQADLSAIESNLHSGLISEYGILGSNSDFSTQIDNSSIVTYSYSNAAIKNVTSRIEAVTDLLPSTFMPDNVLPGYYYTTFSFDQSFIRLRNFSDGVLHVLKIQIYLNCVNCVQNSRTLFLVYNPSTSSYRVAQYPYIHGITDYNSMSNTILKAGISPDEILSTDTTTPYIPINVYLDLNSLNPSDPTLLGIGSLHLPIFMPNGTDYFINFPGANPTTLNQTITIQAIAEPFIPNIIPAATNNIIKINDDDYVGISGLLNPAIGDIVVEITNE
jgi:hypothetical protein